MSSPKDGYPNDERKYPTPGPTGAAPFSPAVEAALYRLAPSRATILLVGGWAEAREEAARALHERSGRSAQPFVVFDCSGLSSADVEARLFGGPAYAIARGGAIQMAAAGTLYVSSIDQLPLLEQPRFLRFLDQERAARVVASAAGDLLALVEGGGFRLDLAERLMLVELVLPDVR